MYSLGPARLLVASILMVTITILGFQNCSDLGGGRSDLSEKNGGGYTGLTSAGRQSYGIDYANGPVSGNGGSGSSTSGFYKLEKNYQCDLSGSPTQSHAGRLYYVDQDLNFVADKCSVVVAADKEKLQLSSYNTRYAIYQSEVFEYFSSEPDYATTAYTKVFCRYLDFVDSNGLDHGIDVVIHENLLDLSGQIFIGEREGLTSFRSEVPPFRVLDKSAELSATDLVYTGNYFRLSIRKGLLSWHKGHLQTVIDGRNLDLAVDCLLPNL